MILFDPQGRTDRLETILQAVEQSQQTGIINVQRGKGGVSEKGSITFLYGQAVDAKVGERSGVEALNWLKTWNSCQYIFTSQAPNEISVPPPPAKPAPAHKITSPLSFVAQMMPRSASHETTKSDSHKSTLDTPARPIEHSPAKAVEQIPFEPVKPVQTPTRPKTFPDTPASLPSFQAPTYTPPGYNPPSYNPIPQSPAYNPVTPVPQTYRVQTPQPTAHIPFRLLQGPEALSYIQKAGLSRLHRHIFFLLDGQRSADDLARLTGHQIIDILRLLTDLERIGLIRQE
jgi:hypothetical protein